MTAGRPTTYRPEICELVIEPLSQGASIEELGLELGIGYSTIYEWMDKYPAFAEAIKYGREFSKGWWLKEGRVNLQNKAFSYVGWHMNMQNRFGWRNNSSVDQNTTHKLDPENITELETAKIAHIKPE